MSNSQLSAEQISTGIGKCIENAMQHFEAGSLLLESGFAPMAVNHFIVTIEELGKIPTLSFMSRLTTSNSDLWADAWYYFTRHGEKSAASMMRTYADFNGLSTEGLIELVKRFQSSSGVLERYRQASLYVDYDSESKSWRVPGDIGSDVATEFRSHVRVILAKEYALLTNGLYSIEAIRLQHEVYSSLNVGRPGRKKVTKDLFDKLLEQHKSLHPIYCSRLVGDGIVEPKVVETLLGTKLL